MLLRNDDDKERGPITQYGQKVAKDGTEMLPSGNTGNGIGNEHEKYPEKAGYHGKGTTKCLDGESGGICTGNVVGTLFSSAQDSNKTRKTHIALNDNITKRNLPAFPQGDNTWAINAPVFPSEPRAPT